MPKKIEPAQEKVLALLMMRFKIPPSQSVSIVQQWIDEHPEESYENLKQSLENGLIRVEKQQFINLYTPEINRLVNKMRGENGIEIKDRNYRLKKYSQCFIGSETVKWFIDNYQTTKAEALKLGQNLITEKIIHHVTDDHEFKDDFLFYRFYVDE